jgi:hypothetical protein
MKMYEKWRYKFLTLVLDGGRLSGSCSGHFISKKETAAQAG